MNWGHYTIIAFVLFASFIIYFVVRSFQQNFDLVAEDYYAKEINYEDKITRKRNFEKLNQKVIIKQLNQQIIVSFSGMDKPSEGSIHFYHHAQKIFDKTFPVFLDENNQQKITKSLLVSGRYRINIHWKTNDTAYIQQERIFIQ